MSNEKNALTAMLEQYEANNKPKYEKTSESNVYDLKNYFNTYIKEGVKSATKTIRILPTTDGSSPFVEMHGHKIKVDGSNKIFPCLKHEKDEPCPMCETRELLLAKADKSDSEYKTDKELAKAFNARLYYIVKVIDRENEEEGVKFWRIPHDYRKEGVYDKIFGVLNAIKKDVTHPETGRDLVLTINRNQNNFPIVSAVASLDPSPLSEDSEKAALWLSDDRTWSSVYATRNYDYLEIVVKGGVPAWDKDKNCFVDKESLKDDERQSQGKLESELTMGIENVKAGLQAAVTSSVADTDMETSDESDDSDDLPF